MKLLCKPNSQTANTGLSSVTSVGLSLPPEMTGKQPDAEGAIKLFRVEAVDRDSLPKVILKGTAAVWEAREKAGDVQRQGHILYTQFLLLIFKNPSAAGSTIKRMRHIFGSRKKCSTVVQLWSQVSLGKFLDY